MVWGSECKPIFRLVAGNRKVKAAGGWLDKRDVWGYRTLWRPGNLGVPLPASGLAFQQYTIHVTQSHTAAAGYIIHSERSSPRCDPCLSNPTDPILFLATLHLHTGCSENNVP